MANPTTNFGWVMPTSTDLVTDLPADFAIFGQAVDTSMAELKGGTTGQVLSKTSNTDMDFTWVAQDDSNAIQNAIVDAKGDLIAASAADTPARLAVGNNGETLVADSSTATGLKWAAPTTSGALKFIARTTFSNVATQNFDSVFSSTYKTYQVVIESIEGATNFADLHLQFRYGTTTVTAGYYGSQTIVTYTGTQTLTTMNNANQILLLNNLYNGAGNNSSMNLTVTNVGNSSQKPMVYGTGFDSVDAGIVTIGAKQEGTSETYTGFLLKASAGNISGTVAFYGLATA